MTGMGTRMETALKRYALVLAFLAGLAAPFAAAVNCVHTLEGEGIKQMQVGDCVKLVGPNSDTQGAIFRLDSITGASGAKQANLGVYKLDGTYLMPFTFNEMSGGGVRAPVSGGYTLAYRAFIASAIPEIPSGYLLEVYAGIFSGWKEFMQIGDSIYFYGSEYAVLKDMSGMPYGTSYKPAASFDLFKDGTKIDSFTLQSGIKNLYEKNGATVLLTNAFVGTGGSAYAQVAYKPVGPTPTAIPSPSPSPTPVPVRIISIGPGDPLYSPGCNAKAQGAAHDLASFRRDVTDCHGAIIERQLIYTNGGYCNVKCANRYQEQCIDDGTFDKYYNEFDCVYAAPSVTPTPTASPSPAPSYCNIMYNLILSPPNNGAETCGFTIMPSAFHSHPTNEYNWMMDYYVNGKLFQTAPGYASTITTGEGERALYLLMGDEFTSNSALVSKIIPFERYYKNLRQWQTVTLADGEVITVISAGASTDGCGKVVFDVAPSSGAPHRQYELRTGDYAGIGRVNAYLFGVGLDGSVTVGFTPSVLQLPAPGTVSDQPNGLNVISGSHSIYCDASKPRNENAPMLYRTVRSCGTRKAIGDPQVINLEYGYGNYECSSRYQEQCIYDGSDDAFYEESCKNVQQPTPTATVVPSPTPTAPPNNATEIVLRAGWNMFATPVTSSYAGGGRIASTTCNPATLWNWNPATRSYETPGRVAAGTVMEATKGYWAYARTDCSVFVEGSEGVSLEGKRLSNGWNQIGGETVPVSFRSISTTCRVAGGPWGYDPQRGYYRADVLEPKRGYFVRVIGGCTLSHTEENPPGFPEG